jgi:hypothetical protein
MLGSHPDAVVAGQAAPGDGAIGLDEEGGRTRDGSAARLAALVDDSPGADCLAFNIGQKRVIQTEPVRETRRLLDGVDRNRDDLGAGGMDFGKT